MDSGKELKGIVFSVQKFSTEDGPGIRTTVFMKGCPLRCKWCQNPEGLRIAPDLFWYDVKCIGCLRCVKACPEKALSQKPEGIVVDRKVCKTCGKCVEECPAGAREIIGKEWTVSELLAEVLKDKTFYDTSGGGVTASGGEPTMQPEFLIEFLRRCKEAKVHTAIETSGFASWATYERTLPYVDLVLYDLKEIDPEKHLLYTCVPVALVLENAKKISAGGKPMWIRTPLIPGMTLRDDNVRGIAEFISMNLKTVERWDLLPYHRLGESKYERLDMQYDLKGVQSPSQEQMEHVAEIVMPYNIKNVVAKSI